MHKIKPIFNISKLGQGFNYRENSTTAADGKNHQTTLYNLRKCSMRSILDMTERMAKPHISMTL